MKLKQNIYMNAQKHMQIYVPKLIVVVVVVVVVIVIVLIIVVAVGVIVVMVVLWWYLFKSAAKSLHTMPILGSLYRRSSSRR